jgi:hypothetical protein
MKDTYPSLGILLAVFSAWVMNVNNAVVGAQDQSGQRQPYPNRQPYVNPESRPVAPFRTEREALEDEYNRLVKSRDELLARQERNKEYMKEWEAYKDAYNADWYKNRDFGDSTVHVKRSYLGYSGGTYYHTIDADVRVRDMVIVKTEGPSRYLGKKWPEKWPTYSDLKERQARWRDEEAKLKSRRATLMQRKERIDQSLADFRKDVRDYRDRHATYEEKVRRPIAPQ